MLEYNQSPRVAFGRLSMRLGEIERARTIFEEIGGNSVRARRRSNPGNRAVVPELARVVRGPLARALEHAARRRDRRADRTTQLADSSRAIKGLVEADLGLVEEARASAEVGSRVRRGPVRGDRVPSSRSACSAGSSSHSATSRRPRATCATSPDGCSRRDERSDAPHLGRRDRDAGHPR